MAAIAGFLHWNFHCPPSHRNLVIKEIHHHHQQQHRPTSSTDRPLGVPLNSIANHSVVHHVLWPQQSLQLFSSSDISSTYICLLIIISECTPRVSAVTCVFVSLSPRPLRWFLSQVTAARLRLSIAARSEEKLRRKR